MLLRKYRPCVTGIATLTRFNEAAALLLRKFAALAGFPAGLSCFNEAAALLLRKSRDRTWAAVVGQASMRPQHCCCGNPRCAAWDCRITSCFNEAAALLLRK